MQSLGYILKQDEIRSPQGVSAGVFSRRLAHIRVGFSAAPPADHRAAITGHEVAHALDPGPYDFDHPWAKTDGLPSFTQTCTARTCATTPPPSASPPGLILPCQSRSSRDTSQPPGRISTHRTTRTVEDRCPLISAVACCVADSLRHATRVRPVRCGPVRCLCGGPVGWIRVRRAGNRCCGCPGPAFAG